MLPNLLRENPSIQRLSGRGRGGSYSTQISTHINCVYNVCASNGNQFPTTVCLVFFFSLLFSLFGNVVRIGRGARCQSLQSKRWNKCFFETSRFPLHTKQNFPIVLPRHNSCNLKIVNFSIILIQYCVHSLCPFYKCILIAFRSERAEKNQTECKRLQKYRVIKTTHINNVTTNSSTTSRREKQNTKPPRNSFGL